MKVLSVSGEKCVEKPTVVKILTKGPAIRVARPGENELQDQVASGHRQSLSDLPSWRQGHLEIAGKSIIIK